MAERVINCPGCRTPLSIDEAVADRFQCPQCGQMIGLRKPGAAAPPPRPVAAPLPSVARPPAPRPPAVRRPAPPVAAAVDDDEDETPEEDDEPQPEPRPSKKKRKKPAKSSNVGGIVMAVLGGLALLGLVVAGIFLLPQLFGGGGAAMKALPANAALSVTFRPAALEKIPVPQVQQAVRMFEAQAGPGAKISDLTGFGFAMNSPTDMTFALEASKMQKPPGSDREVVETYLGYKIWGTNGVFAFVPNSRSAVFATTLAGAKAAIDRLKKGGGGLALPRGHDLAAAVDLQQVMKLAGPFGAAMPADALKQLNGAKLVTATVNVSGANLNINARVAMPDSKAAADAVALAEQNRKQIPANAPPQAKAFLDAMNGAKLTAQGSDIVFEVALPLDTLAGLANQAQGPGGFPRPRRR